MAIDETKEFLDDPEIEMTDTVCEDQLNLLHVICDSHIALHSIEMAIQVCCGFVAIYFPADEDII